MDYFKFNIKNKVIVRFIPMDRLKLHNKLCPHHTKNCVTGKKEGILEKVPKCPYSIDK